MGGQCHLIYCYCSDIHHFIPHMHGISGMSRVRIMRRKRFICYESYIFYLIKIFLYWPVVIKAVVLLSEFLNSDQTMRRSIIIFVTLICPKDI